MGLGVRFYRRFNRITRYIMITYDIAVVGAGAAGSMAAIRAAGFGKRVVLIERNNSIGKKVLLTGNGRCNLTNTAPIDSFIEKFGAFFRPAFQAFSNEDLIDFFRSKGLGFKTEEAGRVFPVTDKAGSIVEILKKCLLDCGTPVLYNKRLTDIEKRDNIFCLSAEDKNSVFAKKVILATGGFSYRATGSSGDGFKIARRLGHAIAPLGPALVPLRTKEQWVKKLQGLSLIDVSITLVCGRKKVFFKPGELIFTHFGISGPLVLDASREVVFMLDTGGEVRIDIDLKPALEPKQIEDILLGEFKAKGRLRLKNALRGMLPERLIPVIMSLANISAEKQTSRVEQKERRELVKLIKTLPLRITAASSIDEAMVTSGGVSIIEINPRTMESKIVPGLYFAGEIIEGCGPSGGYNLQQAFSTGYLAGEKAAHA